MARHTLACVVAIITLSAATEQARWSRQISSYTSDLSDWVPLPGPVEREDPAPLPNIKRQAVAEPRILAEPIFPGFQRPTGFSQELPGRSYFNPSTVNRQLFLQSVPSVPSAPQNYLSDQGFGRGIRFGLSQQNYPLNQGFVGPQLSFESAPLPPTNNHRQKTSFISNPIAYPKTNLQLSQAKQFIFQQPQNTEVQKTVDGYQVDGFTNFQSMKKPQTQKKLKFEIQEKIPKTEMIPPRAKSEKEEVQLLYVPLESLNKGQFNQYRSSIAAPQVIKPVNFNNQNRVLTNPVPVLPKQNFAAEYQRPVHQTHNAHNLEYHSNFNNKYNELDQTPKFSTISTPFPTTLPTTPKPKKLKPHQPPLAIFLAHEVKKGNQAKVGDVLSSLKNADTVAVLDSVNPQTAPKVFIGPSNLAPPENFVRFELPYLSNIEHSDKKLRQLPFFVAPLSYKTPQGFAKIPFPSPHVGSVVINSQIKDSATQSSLTADVIPNSYTTSPQTYVRHHEQNPFTPHEPQQSIQPQTKTPVTQKPSVSFFTTSPPKTNAPIKHQSNYYSFEPQTVSTVKPPPKEPQVSIGSGPPKQPGSYFLNDAQFQSPGAQSPTFDLRHPFNSRLSEPAIQYNPTQPPTSRSTVPSTSAKPSTYPNELLETHNPYSINQAFHFSTPLDYHNLFEENYATAGPAFPQQSSNQTSQEPTPSIVATPSSFPSSNSKLAQPVTDKVSHHFHHESELTNTRYQVTNNNEFMTKPEANEYSQISPDHKNYSLSSLNSPDFAANIEPQPLPMDHLEPINKAHAELDAAIKSAQYQYETNYEVSKESSLTSNPKTTTTRRTPIRNRGRPRYTTPKADSNESTSRTVVTRKPLRERRPLPPRTKYEPNKISAERSTRKPVDSSETTTKYTRSRTRGRVQYKPAESEEYYKSSKVSSSKENDLAYQRDILHQNYPVTIMERSSTLDIEAITEPLPKISSTNILEFATAAYDTENAYSYDRAAVSQHFPNTASNSKEEYFTPGIETQTEINSQLFSSKDDPLSKSSLTSGADDIHQLNESPKKTENFGKQTTELLNLEVTEPAVPVTEQSPRNYSYSDIKSKIEGVLSGPDQGITKLSSYQISNQEEPEENIVQTTPSYNRVRIRPGVVRQYHQASTTESPRGKAKRPAQPVTYRPAFDRRRTTMKIEEIEADLKTKPLHSRPEQDYRHPVYRPEPTTEPSVTAPYSQEATTKRGTFRRRRPTYSSGVTSSTEASSSNSTNKRTYELKNRFRGRRPTTEKAATEKQEIQTDDPTTSRSTIYNRYTRPRLSDRFNKKPEPENSEDQDSNYSINIPKYVEPEIDHWSPKVFLDSFKPYNPNEIADDTKTTTAIPIYDNEDIITARNKDYDDILLTVTPASNNDGTYSKIPDIPPTLEALVDQSKTTSDSTVKMSTFETMLEQVMKSLDEQDEHEYTKNVMKHKGGEIGEIPPERIISSGDNMKSTTVMEKEVTTEMTSSDQITHKEDENDKPRRRGFWKKVKVARPVTTESIQAAESQYYTETVNHLGKSVEDKTVQEKFSSYYKPIITTYKPAFEFLHNIFQDAEDDVFPTERVINFRKFSNKATVSPSGDSSTVEIGTTKTESITQQAVTTEAPTTTSRTTTTSSTTTTHSTRFTKDDNPFDITSSFFVTTTVRPARKKIAQGTTTKKTEKFSFMEYLFGTTTDEESQLEFGAKTEETDFGSETTRTNTEIEITTETTKPRLPTTETTYVPEEITESGDERGQSTNAGFESKKVSSKENSEDNNSSARTQIETSSVSSYMDPMDVVSTSMSTEISHDTEICFRGKCFKHVKDILGSDF